MKIKDYRDAQLHYTKDDRGDATGAFEMFVAEEPSSMVPEPRRTGFSNGGSYDYGSMQYKIDSVKAAYRRYKKGSQTGGRGGKMTFEQFAPIWAKENFAEGGQAGQLVQPSNNGLRPGYSGSKYTKALMLLKNLNKTGPLKGLEEKLIRKYKSEGMDLLKAIKKAQTEAGSVRYESRMKIIDNAMKETNVRSDDYVDLLDMKIKLEDPDFAKDYTNFSETLKNKTRSRYDSDWAEANFGEEYGTKLDQARVREINESIDPNITERSLVDDIDDMNKANIDDLFGRKKNADGGFQQLVQPNNDGSRPGYQGEKFTVGSGPGTGDALTSDRNTKIVKTALNKIKKQINNKPYFEWSEKSDWYKKLQAKLGGRAEGVGMNRDFTNQLINKVVNENFPDSYHGKNAIKNLRQDMVVNGFVEYLKDNGEFDGGEKFLKSLEKFEGKDIDHKYERINSSWKSWIAGEFEVEGVDRTQLAKELETRGIDYSKIENWSASASQKRGLKKKAAIEFLDNQNNKFPKRSFEDVEKLYKQKFPDRNIYLDVNTLTDIKRTGIYKSGDSTTSKYKSVSKGNRANWLKESYGKQFQGNYSKLIKAADQLEAAGEFKKAKRIYDAADKFFGPNGIITNAKGEGEHALARLFDVYGKPDINGNILPNPNRQLAINSLVSGNLNQFKKNFFDIPVKRFFDEYNDPNTTAARRKELKTLIEDRKKTMNSLTGGQTKGIVAGDIVRFQYTPDKIIATSNVEALDTKFKKGEFDIQKYLDRGNFYDEAFKTVGSQADIFTKTGDIKSTYSKPINEKKANLLSQFCNRKKFQLAGSVQGLTCSMEEIQTNMKKQINEAAKVSKDGKIPKKFGKLRGFAKMFFGDIAIPLEYMFMAPDLAAGDVEGALRSSTAGLFGAGKVDLEKLPPGEGKKYIKHVNALTNFLNNYQSKLMAENSLENLNVGDEEQTVFVDQLAQAEKNMADIIKNYQSFGYTYAPGEKGLLEGKVAAQKLIRDKVTSDFDKKINKGTSTEFFKDSNKELLKENLRSLGGDPYKVTPINNLENYIKNKGEATAGNTNILFNRLPYTLEQAEAYGVPQIFDTYAGGYAGVETPGSMEDGQVDMGTKDVRDAYSSLPINMASQLAALEKKEFEEGMLKSRLEQELFAGGGIAGLSGGDKSGRPPESGPASQGLRSLFNNGKKR